MRIKFNNARKPVTLEVQGEKHLTLSNRQLSVQLLNLYGNTDNIIHYKLGWSIDRITLVGTIRQTKNIDGTVRDLDSIMQDFISSGYHGVEQLPKGWILRNRQKEQIAYVEYLDFDINKGRIDFNPNKLSDYIELNLKEFINLIFTDIKFSRIDVACDIFNIPEEFIEQYKIIKDLSSHVYRGRGGNLETIYWGSSSSERQVRLYNKLKERKKKGAIVADGIDSWWRFEAQLRGQTTKEWFSSISDILNYFTSPNFIPLDILGMERITLISLIEHPELFKEIGSNATKAKYRKLLNRITENDELTTSMLEQFEGDMNDIQVELDSWLGYIDITENYAEDD